MTVEDLVIDIFGFWPVQKIDILDCRFADKSQVHNWENYITFEMKKKWKTLTEDARLAMFIMAYSQAENEEWS